MLLAVAFCLANAKQNPVVQSDDIGIQGPTILVIYKERSVLATGVPVPSSESRGSGGHSDSIKRRNDAGTSLSYDRVGLINWSVNDGGINGVPCKIYRGDGEWHYETHTNKDGINYHLASYSMLYYIGLDGLPMHSESHFEDVKNADDSKARIVDVSAEYKTDHIDVTIKKNGVVDKQELYPSFGMERFANMFLPLIRSGIVQEPERDCAVLHPYTGLPYEFKLKVRGHFSGQYFFLPQEGYCVDVVGAEGQGSAYVTRQGQLIQEELPNRESAILEMGPDVDQRSGWGHFSVTDWNKSTDETNPERPKYNTLAIPVLFNNPPLLFPVPCVVAK